MIETMTHFTMNESMEINKAWQECLDEAKEICQFCNGDGYTAEHDPSDPHIDGQCMYCPIQVECYPCKAVGYKYNYQLAAEKYAVRFLQWVHWGYEISMTDKENHEKFIEENNK